MTERPTEPATLVWGLRALADSLERSGWMVEEAVLTITLQP
jgi:hypothetical protein